MLSKVKGEKAELESEEAINDMVVLLFGIVSSVYCFLIGLAETSAVGTFSSRGKLILVLIPIFTLLMIIGIAESMRTSVSVLSKLSNRVMDVSRRLRKSQ